MNSNQVAWNDENVNESRPADLFELNDWLNESTSRKDIFRVDDSVPKHIRELMLMGFEYSISNKATILDDTNSKDIAVVFKYNDFDCATATFHPQNNPGPVFTMSNCGPFITKMAESALLDVQRAADPTYMKWYNTKSLAACMVGWAMSLSTEPITEAVLPVMGQYEGRPYHTNSISTARVLMDAILLTDPNAETNQIPGTVVVTIPSLI